MTRNLRGMLMAKYEGVVNLGDDDIEVDLEFENGHIRLSSSGTEIGLWSTTDCLIESNGTDGFTINAEAESLRFVPYDPAQFAAQIEGPAAPPPAPVENGHVREAPRPKPTTMVLFYLLCAVTTGLAAWALITIISAATS